LAFDFDSTSGGAVETGQEVEDGRFPGAALSIEGDHLAGGNLQVGSAYRGRIIFPRFIVLLPNIHRSNHGFQKDFSSLCKNSFVYSLSSYGREEKKTGWR
jgi:hypothetical protein